MEYLGLVARFALAAVFVVAGLAKLRHSDDFARAIAGYELLPRGVVPAVAVWLPRLEVGAGTLLLAGFLIVPTAVVLAAALVIFTAAVALALLRGREIDCGCFGTVSPRRITWSTVGRNVVLLTAAIVVAADPPHALAPNTVIDGGASSPLDSSDALGVLVATTATLAALAVAGEAWRVGRRAPLVGLSAGVLEIGAER